MNSQANREEYKEPSLEEYLHQVQDQMNQARECGIRGATMVQRIEGDLRRLMNSAFLNLSDLIYDFEKKNDDTHACALNRSMDNSCTVCGKQLND